MEPGTEPVDTVAITALEAVSTTEMVFCPGDGGAPPKDRYAVLAT
jgi:hypothetical protein